MSPTCAWLLPLLLAFNLAYTTALQEPTAAHVVGKALVECVRLGSLSCLKPRLLAYLSSAARKQTVRLTDTMSIERTADFNTSFKPESGELALQELLQNVDGYLTSHQLNMKLPPELVTGSMVTYVPKFLLRDLPPEVSVPLAQASDVAQERGFIKKIVMPFLLGLKFKATALVPLALGLIAMKTWKALTLGLLSLVLSGAMLVFKLTKPKVVNYEVYHYPQPAPLIEHAAPAPAYDPHHGWGRAASDPTPTPDLLAYRGHAPSTSS